MKKQNRNVCAYIRQPNITHNQQLVKANNDKLGKSDQNQNIYKQIVGQMDPQITKYLSKLVSLNEKEETKKKSVQKYQNHERTKSYADILIVTSSSTTAKTKTINDKCHGYRGSYQPSQLNKILFSLNNSPTNELNKDLNTNIKNQSVLTTSKTNQFVQFLDNYINDLSVTKSTITTNKQQYSNDQQIQRKTVQKFREKSENKIKIAEKLQTITRKQKQLRLTNHILQIQNEKLVKKVNEMKTKYKNQINQLLSYTKQVQQQLIKITREKQKLQQTIQDFQHKFSMLRPQRKTSAARLYLNDQCFISSSTTEQDSPEFLPHYSNCYQPEITDNKNRKRKSVPKNTTKHNRVDGPVQISTLLSKKQFKIDDYGQSEDEQI